MKKSILSFVLLAVLIGKVDRVYSQIEVENNLVACYPFNGNANDESGNGNNGVVYGATLTTDRFGIPNSAYSFNGVNNYIEVPNSPTLKSIGEFQQLTVSAWVNVSNWYQGWNIFGIVDKYDSADDGGWGVELYSLGYTVNGPGVGFFPSLSSNTGCQFSFSFDSWYHIAVTYDGIRDSAKFYINGSLCSAVAYSAPISDTSNGALYIGYSITGPNEFSNGIIDDIRVYNRALTREDVSAIFDDVGCNAIAAPPVTSFQASDSTICADNCISYTDLSTNATAWKWRFPGAIDSTSALQNPQNICYLQAGAYNVTLISSNAVGSDSLTFTDYIHVLAAPPTPVIIQLNDTLLYCNTSPGNTSYQWYSDTTLIRGATDTILVIHRGGNYNVAATNENGCKSASGINIVLDIQNYGNDNFLALSPNPATNQLTIHASFFHNEVVTVWVMNVLGQQTSPPTPLSRKIGTGTVEGEDAVIDISNLAAGMYFLQLKSASGSVVKRFVKE